MHYLQFRIVSSLIAVALALLSVSCSKGGSPKMTKEERAFAVQWNKWVDDHQEEMNALRTRAIADDMSEEEVSREMIAFLVRFSSESDLNIPQRFIDDIKKKGASSEGE